MSNKNYNRAEVYRQKYIVQKDLVLALADSCIVSYKEQEIENSETTVKAIKCGGEFGYIEDYGNGNYVVVIRGSDIFIDEKENYRITFKNWIRNFQLFPTIDNCHNGVFKSYLKLSGLMAYIRDSLLTGDIKSLGFVGHSKGGPISHLFYKKLCALLTTRGVPCYNVMFAPPRFLRGFLTTDLNVHSFWRKGGIVPWLPPFFKIPGVHWVLPRLNHDHGFFGNILNSHNLHYIKKGIKLHTSKNLTVCLNLCYNFNL